ncbi:MAG TPA: IS66 family insertion sequence hypothetical protein [Thiolapillus brandeum]|uniref:IS66 family insertion sequence element accessory protein TnpB n=1 Tax=Thiolapillus brandeum TaxID=1076588 RepID=A0A831K2U7_9GAMM|nr:IS66 family insertion sequence hypothetical protein [Thiolapillus brandeum]
MSTHRHTPSEWQQLIEAQQASGLSQKAFCQENGIARATFGYWKRKLKQEQPVVQGHMSGSSWIELSRFATEPSPTAYWQIELDLGNGVCLRLNPVR